MIPLTNPPPVMTAFFHWYASVAWAIASDETARLAARIHLRNIRSSLSLSDHKRQWPGGVGPHHCALGPLAVRHPHQLGTTDDHAHSAGTSLARHADCLAL